MNIYSIVLISFVIGFIVWQFLLIKKYAFHFDKFNIDIPNRKFSINNATFNFDDVEYITIDNSNQPTIMEKFFSKSAAYTYISDVIFHMKNHEIATCAFNYKKTLYKALCELKPYIRIDDNIENYS